MEVGKEETVRPDVRLSLSLSRQVNLFRVSWQSEVASCDRHIQRKMQDAKSRDP